MSDIPHGGTTTTGTEAHGITGAGTGILGTVILGTLAGTTGIGTGGPTGTDGIIGAAGITIGIIHGGTAIGTDGAIGMTHGITDIMRIPLGGCTGHIISSAAPVERPKDSEATDTTAAAVRQNADLR